VDYRGYVEDIREFYRQSRVYIAPVTSGGGIRTKIIEAMAAGIPVVTNSFAPNGLGLEPETHFLSRDCPMESAQSILRLLHDDDLWLKLRTSARARVETSFGLEQAGSRVRERYLEFLQEVA
jgi:glycosyltransferase involved in cell wall biosynthesis